MIEQKNMSPDVELFATTVQEVMLRLRTAGKQEDIFTALSYAASTMDSNFAKTPQKVLTEVACRAGCNYCCHVPLGVQAHEVLLAANHIKTHFNSGEIVGVIESAAAHRKRIATMPVTEYWRALQPCPLLRDGSCSIYEARPEVCRAHHGSNAQVCKINLENHNKTYLSSVLEPLRSRMFGIMLGIDQAVAEAGFDGRAYDFGSALHEALTNSSCAYLWGRKMQTFPDSCREKPAEEGGEYGEIHAGILTPE